MPSRNIINLIRLIAIIGILNHIIELLPNYRSVWQWGAPHVTCIYDYITYDDDLIILARMTRATFDHIANQVYEVLLWPSNWFAKDGNFETDYKYDGKLQPHVLSPFDRLLRYFMLNTNHSVHSLEVTFGQHKSIIYADYKTVAMDIVFALGEEWCSLPRAGTPTYNSLLGQGVFTRGNEVIFANIPYICDVTSIRIQRPTDAQRSFYNGHKKYHTVDFHCAHSGKGRVYSVIGPVPGSHNDIQQAQNSLLYTRRDRYLLPGHGVLADLAYHDIGDPFVCRIAYQSSYSDLENAYNMDHSRCRVISENYYSRWKLYWSYFLKPWAMKLDDIGMAFRALVIVTNIIITVQDPLRSEFIDD